MHANSEDELWESKIDELWESKLDELWESKLGHVRIIRHRYINQLTVNKHDKSGIYPLIVTKNSKI